MTMTKPGTRLPEDFRMYSEGGHISLSFTLATQQELAAVIVALQIMNKTLPSHRLAIAEDFGMVTPPAPTIRDKLIAAGLMPAPARQALAQAKGDAS